ncbi:secretion protein [Pseudalgibacter alginicilyticus]|uniref:Secretion protein n=1 Tax=Pseudalgibacter alginicilyticus TaxID=1736674 RepID=A0A0P0CS47_9FLAO|nr:T9SS type A sorting domain-containing protein [Pseudalgibacter alginicilyticus]ALJ05643.1 secretion protein [Pseudalgibacter alginicilyticus]
MKVIASILFLIFGQFGVFAQISNVTEEFLLPANLSESSGAIFLNNKLITHNDSGGENKLYELDIISGLVIRTVTISNATNVDWEDITQDDTNIYIGDFGNNISGNRTDLKIYKISKTDYLSSTIVTAEIIAFSYSDQIDFTPTTANNTEWDAEALVSFDATNLILFTKNWVNGITKGYLIPKVQGTYSVSPLTTTLNSGGRISGGTFNPFSGKLYLVGYNGALQPFIWLSENFSGNDVFSGINTQTQLSSLGQEQVESITFIDEDSYLVTSESFSITVGPITVSEDAKLVSFLTNDPILSNAMIEEDENVVLYPNPVSSILKVESSEMAAIEIFDTKLTKLYQGSQKNINVSQFSQGIYIVKIHLNSNRIITKKFIKK